MEAMVNLLPDSLPRQYQLILRAVGVGVGGASGGVEVRWVNLQPGTCTVGPSCDFDDGFCSWRVSYTGGTVWYIRPHQDEGEEGSHAAVLVEGNAGDTTCLISETIVNTSTPRGLAFRYRVMGTSRCLSVGQQESRPESKDTITIWKQCRGKGHHWLTECVTLPPTQHPYQVVLTAETAEESTEVWVDDVEVIEGGCNDTSLLNASSSSYSLPNSTLSPDALGLDAQILGLVSPSLSLDAPPQWECAPLGSLCGMTQPKFGQRDWVYVDAPLPENETIVSRAAISSSSSSSSNLSTEAPRTVDHGLDASEEGPERSCRDGSPLKEAWICDGIPDCPDHSDEEECDCEKEKACDGSPTFDLHLGAGVCAHGAFRCPSGRACPPEGCRAPPHPCLPRDLLCDGIAHCAHGEDEAPCSGVARPNPAHVDVAASNTMTCSGGLRIPAAWRCDGRKDCPSDGLDEMGCAYCGPEEFICPTSGVCVPKEQVCDGSLSLPSCTDDQYCDACPPAHLACDVCVASWQICDGVWDCEGGEDERECVGVGVGVGGVEECAEGHYRCPSGHCLPELSVCDRRIDCPDGDDERHCLDDNFSVPRYLSVKPSPVPGSVGKRGGPPSRLVTPTLYHPPGGVGVLTFKYRLDAWLGASNATLSLDMVDAEDPTVGVRPWAVWRQSGHKGRHWLSATVLIPPQDSLNKYKLAFLVSHDDHVHESQQLHLAQLAFRVVVPQALNQLGEELLQCDFSDSLCGWSQPTTEGGYSWVLARASAHTRRTGPITGYPDVGGSGFVFADSLHGAEGSTADLLSPPLLLPEGPDPALCFRFAVFLYGAHVAKVSVHVLQRLADGTHSVELFRAAGGRGLSWVPVGVTVDAGDVADPLTPLVLGVRATRGPGTEADIALDHVAVLSGACHSLHAALNASLALNATLTRPDASALSAGPALTPLAPTPAEEATALGLLETPSPSPSPPPAGGACEERSGCVACAAGVARARACTWCDMTQACVPSDTPAAHACPDHLAVHHNTTRSQQRRGPGWCPQLEARQERQVLVGAGSSPLLTFPVRNIQPTQTESGWICLFEPLEEEAKQETKMEEMRGNFIDEDEEEEKEALEKRLKLEEDFDFKKRKEEIKRSRKGWRGTKEGTLRLPGHFQGRVLEVGGGSGTGVGAGVGVGAIRCGDGVTELRPTSPRPHAHYTVRILTPAGAPLDNPDDVRLVVYSCDLLASSCHSCVAANASFSCGWCVTMRTCTTHAHCLGTSWLGPGRTCDTEELLKSVVGEEEEAETGLGEPLEPLEDDPTDRHSHKDDLGIDNIDVFPSGSDRDVDVHKEEEVEEEGEEEGAYETSERRKNKRKRTGKGRKVSEEGEEGEGDGISEEGQHLHDMINDSAAKRVGRVGGRKRAGKRTVKGKVKVTGRGRSFLRLPQHPGLYIARNAWRLHTGRQYYIPVARKTLINLGFVRQVTYGSLAEEKPRTVLINSAWKKAAGYYVDLFEKVDKDPVTSVITTSRSVFEQLLVQLIPDE